MTIFWQIWFLLVALLRQVITYGVPIGFGLLALWVFMKIWRGGDDFHCGGIR